MVTRMQVIVGGAVAGVGLVAALAVFEPWRAVTTSTVSEPLPVAAVADPPSVAPATAPDPSPVAPAPTASEVAQVEPVESATATPEPEPAEPKVLTTGAFEDAEHSTTGSAQILELADGSRFVRLVALDTSDGPDLHVWLSSAPSGGSWGSYDDGRSAALGELKANRGSHNYAIPADVDLDGLRSVVIWCDRFNVAFGTAPIRAA